MPSGVVSPACWVVVQQLARGNPASRPKYQLADATSRLDPTEPVRDPAHQLIEPAQPPVRVYAEARGHREIILSPHNPRSSSGGRATPVTNTPQDHDLRLEYKPETPPFKLGTHRHRTGNLPRMQITSFE
jgi:hypothetical protein